MSLPASANAPGLTLISRADCGLCAAMLDAVARLRQSRELPALRVIDVDSEPELLQRFGLHVPVLLLDGAEVSRHRLDVVELVRLLRPR
jgi:hypothetical protein